MLANVLPEQAFDEYECCVARDAVHAIHARVSLTGK
jgi:hypothetical protein